MSLSVWLFVKSLILHLYYLRSFLKKTGLRGRNMTVKQRFIALNTTSEPLCWYCNFFVSVGPLRIFYTFWRAVHIFLECRLVRYIGRYFTATQFKFYLNRENWFKILIDWKQWDIIFWKHWVWNKIKIKIIQKAMRDTKYQRNREDCHDHNSSSRLWKKTWETFQSPQTS